MALTALLAGCGAGESRALDEDRATRRAEQIVHQAVDSMSPRPALRRTGLRPVGACAAEEHGAGGRLQVRLTYQLTGVAEGVGEARLRDSGGFWMTALTGALDKANGEGLGAVSVISPCFAAGSGAAGRS
ncbi:hypothetical protein [Streptomyces seoulensis]|uniref:hypothetical protein n=1 Tax=Streptomyces seoulensis TaxID=73044 RepID=UPI0033B24693